MSGCLPKVRDLSSNLGILRAKHKNLYFFLTKTRTQKRSAFRDIEVTNSNLSFSSSKQSYYNVIAVLAKMNGI